MATVRVFARLKYEGQAEAFYDISSRVDYESLSWESNSEGTSANASIKLWTILPSSSTLVYDYAGATFADKVNAAISDESFEPSAIELELHDVRCCQEQGSSPLADSSMHLSGTSVRERVHAYLVKLVIQRNMKIRLPQ